MKTYTISKENRVQNSPFFVEGSNMAFDIVNEYPLPLECDTFDEKGNPIRIRFIMGCDTIIKEEQVRKGYPENRRSTEQEREMLTFKGGMLSLPEGYKIAEKYLAACPWFKDKKGPRPFNSRIIFEEYSQDRIDSDALNTEALITEARSIVIKGKRADLLAILRLSRAGQVVDPNMDIKALRLNLLEIANSQPEFILKNIKNAKEQLIVQVSKACDYGLMNIDSTGKLLYKQATGFSTVANISDAGGRQQKMERVVAYLESEEGAALLSQMRRDIKQFEKGDDDDDEPSGGVAAGVKTTSNGVEQLKMPEPVAQSI